MITDTNTPAALQCPECKSSINAGAKRCGSCGTELKRRTRYFLRASQFVTAALVFVSLWQYATSTRDAVKTSVSFKIAATGCWPEGIAVSVVNAEKDQVLEWREMRLVSVNEIKVDEPMFFQPGQPRHLAPLSTTNLTFTREESDTRTIGQTCMGGCAMTVSLTAQDVDGNKATTATTECTWTPEKPPLD